ncbi:MAG: hypothetical protein CL537_03050 [Alcanivoracaceae bacterium]|nr:hypothetical protein [Alcanivoracaceae bacterium]|tara:strand:- start:102 stop:698 length:597 start_codon:yes stop_codon:yes gene_type:complete
MNPIRLMAKMTAKGLLIDGSGFGGGTVLITQHDVAGAMGMGNLPAEAELVARSKWCDDNQAQLALAGWVQTEFRRRCMRHGWKTDYCEGLATVCVFELVCPMRCSDCMGRGKVWQQEPERADDGVLLRMADRWVECKPCKGSGQSELTVRNRAAIAKISKSRFSETWGPRADEMMTTLYSLDQKVLRHLWHQFADRAA